MAQYNYSTSPAQANWKGIKVAAVDSGLVCNSFTNCNRRKKESIILLSEMKTTMMAEVCLLALVLTFTIAECGPSQEKRQTATASCDNILQTCNTGCETIQHPQALADCKENCKTAYNVCSGANGGNFDVPDGGNGSDNDDDDEGSGGTAIAGATIFSTISALLVAVASAMN